MYQSENSKQQWPWHAALCTIVLVLFTIIWSAQAALASDLSVVGRIEAMSANGLIGEWQVGSFHFVTSGATILRQENGEFTIGRCVEVDYISVADQHVATKVTTRSDADCQSDSTPTETSTPDPNATPEPTTHPHDDDDDDNDGNKVRALIDAMPEEGFRGIWTIGGVQYEIGVLARLRQKAGPLRIGVCVELHHRGDVEPFTVLRLETERRSTCERNPTDPTPTPTDTPEIGNELYGILEQFPAEFTGEWVISGTGYTATAETEFEQEYGSFAVGMCVKAHLSGDKPMIIREVETTSRFRCNDADNHDGTVQGQFYGMIQEFPTDLIGDWQIGGTTVTADTDTDFQQGETAFAIGVTAHVHFIVKDDGSYYASEIEAKFDSDDPGNDDPGNDDPGNDDPGNDDPGNDDPGDDEHETIYEGAKGHVYGLIETLPENDDLIGTWVVAGISYTVTSDTHLVKPHSHFAVNGMVRVKYRIDADGKLVARQIKATRGNANSHAHAMLFGFVDLMPTSGYVGEWHVSGIEFYSTEKTKFEEEEGLFGLGGYVKIAYYSDNGRKILVEIKSEVPPGAGEDTTVGEIEAIKEDGESVTSTSATVNATIWTIGGRQYVVTAATDLNDFQGALDVGQKVVVNSYSAKDGTVVATQLRGILLPHTLFIPTVNR